LPTLRFAHGEPYLRDAISNAGLELITLEKATIRTEKNLPVDGLLAIALRER
jgi:predicted TPR repeat methyltransferase